MGEHIDSLEGDWLSLSKQDKQTRLAAFINGATDLHTLRPYTFVRDALAAVATPGLWLVDESARRMLTVDTLPAEFNLYRGARFEGDPLGYCWTRDEETAKSYASGCLLTRMRRKPEDIAGILCDTGRETILYVEHDEVRVIRSKWPPSRKP